MEAATPEGISGHAVPGMALPPAQARTVKWLLLLTRFLDQAGYSMFIPCIPFYAKRFGVSPFEMGLIVSLYPLTQFFFNPILGGWSDRVGRRPALLLCGAGLLLCNGAFTICTDLTVFAIIRALGGVFAGMGAVAGSAISDITAPAERTRGMAFIGAGMSFGFLVGPPMGAILDSHGHKLPALAAAVFAAIYLAVLFFLFPETHPHPEDAAELRRESLFRNMAAGIRIVLRSPFLRLCMMMLLTYGMAAVIWEASLGYYVTGAYHGAGSERLYGFMLCFTALVAAAIQLFLLQKVKLHLQEVRLVQWAVLAELAGLVIFSMGASLGLLFVGLLLVASAYAIVPPSSMGLISLHTPRKSQGLVLGISQSMSFASKIVGIPLATALFEVHPLLPFRVAGSHAAVAVALATLMVVIQLRHADQKPVIEGKP